MDAIVWSSPEYLAAIGRILRSWFGAYFNRHYLLGDGIGSVKIVDDIHKFCHRPAVRYILIVVTVCLWILGLGDQLDDPVKIAKYVGISLLLVAVAAI